jgi:hypothetical protein
MMKYYISVACLNMVCIWNGVYRVTVEYNHLHLAIAFLNSVGFLIMLDILKRNRCALR